ncbi:PilN domain-containing protein [Desulfoscipio geothermicus]|uniref:Tfp pilus assembly protein PilN n=1 Tax=Desulfoscipio geothermicus DSM 3669 TaxID=1121426 RepID=A0A1I6DBJ2_9FIRM|nr:PilN domain-containing protein [Desulfoscipio geothermicus]SFR02778.1 Tfp pilus assembly protein PilN [Desulfoscipio geothermicus DSM 3669]
MKAYNIYSKDLNFIPQTVIERARRRRQFFVAAVALWIMGVLLGTIYWIPENMAATARADIREVNEYIAELEKAAPVYEELEEVRKEYRDKLAALNHIEEEDKNFVALLDRVSLALPAGVYISSLKYVSGKTLELSVITDDPVDIARVVVALRNTGLFEEVTLQGKEVPLIKVAEPFTFNLTLRGVVQAEQEEEPSGEVESAGEKNVADSIKEEVESKLKRKLE